MEDNNRQPWLLTAIAAIGLALGVIALIVAFNAKSASDDAATQSSVDQISSELSRLIDRLGIAEATLQGQQKSVQGTADKALRHSESAVVNLSNRLDRLEATTQANSKQTAKLGQAVSSNSAQIKSLNKRVNKLSGQVQSGSGGQNAP